MKHAHLRSVTFVLALSGLAFVACSDAGDDDGVAEVGGHNNSGGALPSAGRAQDEASNRGGASMGGKSVAGGTVALSTGICPTTKPSHGATCTGAATYPLSAPT